MSIEKNRRGLEILESGASALRERPFEHRILGNRREVNTKVLLVLGSLGSGKTSLLKWILSAKGEVLGKLRLIVNDVGTENIDAGRLSEDLLLEDNLIVPLQSGCICCEDIEALTDQVKILKGKIDTIIIEPTGIAEGEAIEKMLSGMKLPTSIITLVDVLHHSRRHAVELQVMESQLKVAKVIGLTWWEKANGEQIDNVLDYIGKINSEAAVVKLPKLAFSAEERVGQSLEKAEYEQLFSGWERGVYFEQNKERGNLFRGHVHGPNCQHGHDHRDEHSHQHGYHHEHSEGAPVFSKSFTDVPNTFSEKDLMVLFGKYENILIRAKGVVAGQRFNYVHGTLTWEKADNGPSHLNFITSEPVDEEKLCYELNIVTGVGSLQIQEQERNRLENLILNYLKMDSKTMQRFTETEVAKLVAMYQDWNQLSQKVAELEKSGDALKIEEIRIKQKSLGEAMTFANPLIWLGYKVVAYKGTEKELKTLADLREHAKRPEYICHKRLTYLSDAYKQKTGQNLWSELPDNTDLQGLLDGEVMTELSMDDQFMTIWQHYEYFKQSTVDGGLRVAKWENWKK